VTQGSLFSVPVSQPYQRRSHTSFKAAARVDPVARGHKTREYLRLLKQHGSLTDPEVCALTSWPRSSVCSIRWSVEHALLVEKSGDERPSPWGRDCAAYRLTASGRAAQAAARR
jgi:hypothetical protein